MLIKQKLNYTRHRFTKKSLVARELNDTCDNESDAHHNDNFFPSITHIPQQIHEKFHNVPLTTKNMSYIQILHQQETYEAYLKKKSHRQLTFLV